MNNVFCIHPSHVLLHTVEDGQVFRVISPKIEGKKHVRNDGIYRKEADSHCVRIGQEDVDCIFSRNTVVEVIPNSRFAQSAYAVA